MMPRPRRDRDIGVTVYQDETETFKKSLEIVSRPRRSRPHNTAVAHWIGFNVHAEDLRATKFDN